MHIFFSLFACFVCRIAARRVSEHAIARSSGATSSYMPSASVHDIKSRFGGDNNSRDFGRNNVGYSKKPAPTPPVMKHKKGLAPQPSGSGDWKPALRPVSPKKVDPIREMKLIGQKTEDDVSV